MQYGLSATEYQNSFLCAHGSRINHLPTALFRAFERCQRLAEELYSQGRECCEESGAGREDNWKITPVLQRADSIRFNEDKNAYVMKTKKGNFASLRPDNTVLCTAFCTDPSDEKRFVLILSIDSKAPDNTEELPDNALVLRGRRSLLDQFYYPVKMFLKSNPGKYEAVGLTPGTLKCTRIAVLDTEMERPYITQFSGRILQRDTGAKTETNEQAKASAISGNKAGAFTGTDEGAKAGAAAGSKTETEILANEISWQQAGRYDTYIRLPEGVHLTPYVAKVTGLTDDFLQENGIEEKEALLRIREFLDGADLICGHSVLADIEILRDAYERAGMEAPACLTRPEMIDTQVLTEYIFDLENNTKLAHAAALAGVTEAGDVFHDARTDAEVTERLFLKLSPRFFELFGAYPVVTDVMLHAPKHTDLLQPILGKKTAGAMHAKPPVSSRGVRHKGMSGKLSRKLNRKSAAPSGARGKRKARGAKRQG